VGFALSADEAVAVSEAVTAFVDVLPERNRRSWEQLAAEAANGEITNELVPALERVCALALETGKARSLGRAEGERLLTAVYRRTPGGSALTADIAVPKSRSAAEMGGGIPITYVPARNTIFLSFALAWAEVLESSDIFIGVNALDYSGYPDCRPEFIEAYERMANLATKAGVEGRTHLKIHTPLLELSKAGIVKLAHELGVPFGLTHSCYDPGPDGTACGECDACLLRRKGFQEAGIEDR